MDNHLNEQIKSVDNLFKGIKYFTIAWSIIALITIL